MEKITMSPEIFSGYTNPTQKYEEVLWQKHQWTGTICKSWIEYRKKYKCKTECLWYARDRNLVVTVRW